MVGTIPLILAVLSGPAPKSVAQFRIPDASGFQVSATADDLRRTGTCRVERWNSPISCDGYCYFGSWRKETEEIRVCPRIDMKVYYPSVKALKERSHSGLGWVSQVVTAVTRLEDPQFSCLETQLQEFLESVGPRYDLDRRALRDVLGVKAVRLRLTDTRGLANVSEGRSYGPRLVTERGRLALVLDVLIDAEGGCRTAGPAILAARYLKWAQDREPVRTGILVRERLHEDIAAAAPGAIEAR